MADAVYQPIPRSWSAVFSYLSAVPDVRQLVLVLSCPIDDDGKYNYYYNIALVVLCVASRAGAGGKCSSGAHALERGIRCND